MEFIFETVKVTATECHGGQNTKKCLHECMMYWLAIKHNGLNSNSSSGSYRLLATGEV